MSEKSEFADGENLRQFLVQVKRVVEWLHENDEKYGLTEKVNDGTVSRALRGEQFDHRLTDALDALHSEAMRDPWKWCAPSGAGRTGRGAAPLRATLEGG